MGKLFGTPTLRESDDQMPKSLYDTCLQGITVVVVIKTNIQYTTMKTATIKTLIKPWHAKRHTLSADEVCTMEHCCWLSQPSELSCFHFAFLQVSQLNGTTYFLLSFVTGGFWKINKRVITTLLSRISQTTLPAWASPVLTHMMFCQSWRHQTWVMNNSHIWPLGT